MGGNYGELYYEIQWSSRKFVNFGGGWVVGGVSTVLAPIIIVHLRLGLGKHAERAQAASLEHASSTL